MKITCLQENLKNALVLAERIVGKNLALPILNNILLKTEKGFLKVSATNLEIGINIWVAAKIEKEGDVSVRARLLVDYINNLPGGKVVFEAKNNKLNVKCDGFKALFLGSETKEFPIIPSTKDKEKYMVLDGETLRKSIGQVINAASLSDNRIELNGIFFNIQKQAMKIAATDSFRLAEKTIQEISLHDFLKNEKNEQFIVPYKTAQEILKIAEGKKEIKIFLSEGQVYFETEDVHLVSRIIEGEYPDYQQIIPKSLKTKITMKKSDLIHATKLSSLFSSKINDVKLKTDKKNSQLNISAKDFELGENDSDIEAHIDGDDIEIAFNYRYLVDGLNNFTDEEITIELNDESQPGFLRTKKDTGYFYIIMPLKIY